MTGPGDCFVQTDRVEMWEFDALFNPSDPWAQRAMLDLVEARRAVWSQSARTPSNRLNKNYRGSAGLPGCQGLPFRWLGLPLEWPSLAPNGPN